MGSTESKFKRHHNNNQDSHGRGRRTSAHLFRYRSNQTSKSKQSSDDDHQSNNSSGKENNNRTRPALSHLQQQGNQIMSRIKRQQQAAQQQKQQKQQQKQNQQEETATNNDRAVSANSESSGSVTNSKHSGKADSTTIAWDAVNRDAMVLAAAHTASAASNGSNTGLSSTGSGTTMKEAVQKIVDEVHPSSSGSLSAQQKTSPLSPLSSSPTMQKKKQYSTSYQPKTASERILMDLFTLPESDARRRKERDRHQRQHYLLKYVWQSNFKIPLESPSLIINWCCGAGMWTMEMAQQFPDCQVVGIDYEQATLPSLAESLKNLRFHNVVIHEGCTGLEDFEDNSADYIMMRDVWMVNSPAYRWEETLSHVYRVLKPGGWVELYEQELEVHHPGPSLFLADRWYGEIFSKCGIDRDITDRLGEYLEQAGFIDIDERAMDLPLGEWSTIPALKQTGYLNKDLMMRRFRNNIPLLCEFNDVSPDQVKRVIEKAFAECDEHKSCMRWFYYAAQKAPQTTTTATL